MGIVVFILVLRSSYSNLLRVEKKPILSWLVTLTVVTALRIAAFWIFLKSGESTAGLKEKLSEVGTIPWPAILGVFWEDFCHSMPLVILESMFSSKWFMPLRILALVTVMIAFGMGHVYEGVGSAVLIAFYIPLSMKMGKKYGFGTVVICHMLYDLCTILTVKWMLGQL